jgi:hypothetical protein
MNEAFCISLFLERYRMCISFLFSRSVILYILCEKNGKWCETNVPRIFSSDLLVLVDFALQIRLKRFCMAKIICVHRRMRYQPVIHDTWYVCHIHLEVFLSAALRPTWRVRVQNILHMTASFFWWKTCKLQEHNAQRSYSWRQPARKS